MELYTAIGRKTMDRFGRFSVEVDGDTYILMGMEPFLWTALTWTFVEKDDIFSRMMWLLDLTFPGESREKGKPEEFPYCFRRMCKRGLITSVSGENKEELIQKLLRRCIVQPSGITLSERREAFWEGIASGRGIYKSLRAFGGLRLNQEEKQLSLLLQRSGDIEWHLGELRRTARLAEEGMDGKAYSETLQNDFLDSVLALYQKKLLVINKVKEA